MLRFLSRRGFAVKARGAAVAPSAAEGIEFPLRTPVKYHLVDGPAITSSRATRDELIKYLREMYVGIGVAEELT